MRYITSILIILFFLGISRAQDTFEVIIQGNIEDAVQRIPIQEAKITLKLNLESEYQTSSDSLGNFYMSVFSPSGKVNIELFIKNVLHSEYNIGWDTIISSNLKMNLNFKLDPKRICSDSFLPSPIMFKKNITSIPEDSIIKLKEHLKSMNAELDIIFDFKKLEISGYSSYDETRRIAKKDSNLFQK